MTSRARVGATLVALAATATAALLVSAPAQAAPGATQAPTNTVLSANPQTIAFGAPAKLKATVKPVLGTSKPSGTVTFNEGTKILGTVSLAVVNQVQTAKLTVNGLSIGDHTFTATYNGSATWAPSGSLPYQMTVTQAASITRLTIGSKTIEIGSTPKVTATVSAKITGTGTPAGSVTFSNDDTVLGTSPLALANGKYQAAWTLPVLALGAHTITASFVPNGGSLGASDATPLDVTVGTLTTTVVLKTVKFDTDNVNVTLTAQVTPSAPTGTVTFRIDALNEVIRSINGSFGQASLKTQTAGLGSGTHTLLLTYSGDATHAPCSATTTFDVP